MYLISTSHFSFDAMLKNSILLFLVFLKGIVFAQSTTTQRLEQAYNILKADSQAQYATTALVVLDANTGKIIFGRNENLGMATASTLKTITAATAFSLLGKDFRYETTLAYTGTISAEGTLKGDLVLVGGGDPTLASWRYEQTKESEVLNQWVKAIKEAGINRIDGAVIGEDSAWGTQSVPVGWIWQDIGNYYGASSSALTWRENQFDVHLKVSNTGVSILRTQPSTPYVKIINELKPGAPGSGDKAYAFFPPLAETAYLRGSWAVGIDKPGISLALPDPAFDVAYRLQDTLKRLGITTSIPPTTTRRLSAADQPAPKITKTISTINSPTLSQIIYWFNKKSINLYGEHLIRTIAWKAGKEASTENGVKEELNYWASKGLDKKAMNIIDGSGLSPGTRVTPLAMATVLFLAQKESWYSDYINSFPEHNGMQLKSGSINDVSSYAGYYKASRGKNYVIVININNYSGTGISKKLLRVLDALK
ncbi:MAG: dacB [Pedobacter sp.]|jgi:D-alanyl-D-alanine carboxypeptidase/D-alanyl-D-alanine-endopeptidase (penicillin-binding protein 4)|nr:dacB [Pedobacter sp.]